MSTYKIDTTDEQAFHAWWGELLDRKGYQYHFARAAWTAAIEYTDNSKAEQEDES